MDHSYSSARDSSSERERLHRQDHCYFAIADKTPLVVQRKFQIRLQRPDELYVASMRDDHTYGRQTVCPPSGALIKPTGKENSTSRGHGRSSPESPIPGTTCKSRMPAQDHGHLSDPIAQEADTDNSTDRQRQDHTYFDAVGPRSARKKSADTSRYDHIYCTHGSEASHKDESMQKPRQMEKSRVHVKHTKRGSNDLEIKTGGFPKESDVQGKQSGAASPDESGMSSSENAALSSAVAAATVSPKLPENQMETQGPATPPWHIPPVHLSDHACYPTHPQQLCVSQGNKSFRLPLTSLTEAHYYPRLGVAEAGHSGDIRSVALISADHDYHCGS